MSKLTIAIITIAAGTSMAWAQGTTLSQTSPPPGVASGSGAASAPVGHRQPRRADVPENSAGSERSSDDHALDRRIRSICRGC